MHLLIYYNDQEKDVKDVLSWLRMLWNDNQKMDIVCQEPFGTNGDVVFACLNTKATINKDGTAASQTFTVYRITTKGRITFEYHAEPGVMEKLEDRQFDHWITEIQGWYPPYPEKVEYNNRR